MGHKTKRIMDKEMMILKIMEGALIFKININKELKLFYPVQIVQERTIILASINIYWKHSKMLI
jgi:hypoxanthine-guanine phosphoribosyltransferase